MRQDGRWTERDLAEKVSRIFERCGVQVQAAKAVGNVIAAGERDNCKSHGVYRIVGCLQALKAGKVSANAVPEIEAALGPIVKVDAKGGYVCSAFAVGRDALVEKARELGMAALVINDCLHFTALWYEIEELTSAGLAAISMCPSYAVVAPHGGRGAVLGTNPFAFGWPRPGGEPYVFDFATSVAARGEIELHRRDGKAIPPDWAVDTTGKPTTDAAAALAGAMLPFGGHKGSAISTMIELMAGALIGDFMSQEALEWVGGGGRMLPRHGALILAFDPLAFSKGRSRSPFEDGERLFSAIVEGGARLPSQRRFEARRKAKDSGIHLTSQEIALLDTFERDGLAAVEALIN